MNRSSRPAQVLLVDDDPVFCDQIASTLNGHYNLTIAMDAETAKQAIRDSEPDLILLDIYLGEGRPDGFTVLEQLRDDPTAPSVVMLTRDTDVNTALRAGKFGAFRYCTKPTTPAMLHNHIELGLREAELRQQLRQAKDELLRLHGDFVVEDHRMREVIRDAERVAPLETTVLITGPSGSGKEFIARRIHELSPRAGGPFRVVNCPAMPRDLLESELFGHERGSFTGASDQHKGAFDQADGGTVFLDEIGEASPEMHAKLLRVLEQKTFRRVGGKDELACNVRFVAASSREPEDVIAAGRFSEPLFYRLSAFRIRVPGLDERPGDLAVLAKYFLAKFARETKKNITDFSPEARQYLRDHKWPGNVRQLKNLIEGAVIRCNGEEIRRSDLCLSAGTFGSAPGKFADAYLRVKLAYRREYCEIQLQRAGGNITHAAALSGMTRQAFSKMMRETDLKTVEA